MDNYFRHKNAIITGGSSGIGLALAEQLAGSGANVTIIARREDVLGKAREKIELVAMPGVIVQAYSTDVTDINRLEAVVKESSSLAGTPDILINSAGIVEPGEFIHLSPQVFSKTMEVNFFGTVHAVKVVLPYLLEKKAGSIVNISSGAGYINVYGYTAYGASKYAVAGFTEALRMELKPKGIHVALVYPPDTDTPQLVYDNEHKPPVTRALSKINGLLKSEKVASEILAGIKKRKIIILPGFENKLNYMAINLLGRTLTHRILDVFVSRALKEDSPGKK